MHIRRLAALAFFLALFLLSMPSVTSEARGDDGSEQRSDRDRDHRQLPPVIDAQAGPTIGGYTLVGERRVSLTQTDFTYRAWIVNPLPVRLDDVRATLTSRSSAIQVVKGSLDFDDVGPKATVRSEDTFTIRHDWNLQLDPADLAWAIGVPLPGSARSLAKNAVFDLPPVGVDETQIKDGVILTRLELRFAADATVGEINAALRRVGGRIVSMSAGDLALTIVVPKQSSLSALERLATLLSAQPGIRLAKPGFEAAPFVLNVPINFDDLATLRHLLPSRFPAAYNAAPRLLDDHGTCTIAPVPVLVADFFSIDPPDGYATAVASFRRPAPPARTLTDREAAHGYVVATTLGGPNVGANPITPCLDVRLVQIAGFAPDQDVESIVPAMPAGRFIVNSSYGYGACANEPVCTPLHDALYKPQFRAIDALTWKTQTHNRWSDFLIFNAGGNERNKTAAAIYPGVGNAPFASAMAIAARTSPQFSFVTDPAQWNPVAPFDAEGFDSMVANVAAVAGLTAAVSDAGMTGPDSIPQNVVVVGSTTSELRDNVLTQHVTPEQLLESAFSNTGSDVLAVGEHIFDTDDADEIRGTSLSSPIVAGLASYLWLLSDDLRNNQPVSLTRQAIVANTRNRSIDAYASVLSLDGVSNNPSVQPTPSTAPVRFRLLDVNGDGQFDEKDIDIFLRHFFAVDSLGNITHDVPASTNADFSRYDLNGDGFTTSGSRREKFDLDRVLSVQYGATSYTTVSQTIEGHEVRFDETALTDLEILCYYAYSPLYTGRDLNARKALLADRCGFTITPTTVTLAAGQTQLFTASASATFTATGGGTINQGSGLFTAGSTSGTFTVRATSTSNTSQFAEATVTVHAGNTVSGQLDISFTLNEGPFPNGESTTERGSLTAFVRAALVTNAFGDVTGLSIVQASGSAEIDSSFTLSLGCSGIATLKSGGGSITFTITNAVTGAAAGLVSPLGLVFIGNEQETTTDPTCADPITSTDPPQNSVLIQNTVFVLRDGVPVRDSGGHITAIDYSTTDVFLVGAGNFPEPRTVTGKLTLDP